MEQRTVYPERAQRYIAATSFWMKCVALSGFVWTILAVLIACVITGDRAYRWYMMVDPTSPLDENGFDHMFVWVSLIVAVAIYSVFSRRRLRAANAVAAIPDADGPYVTEETLKNKATRWRLIGLINIVFLSLLVVLLFLLALAMAAGGTTA